MKHAATLQALLLNDPVRRRALESVASLVLPDCWIAAGFVRDAAWDHLHGYAVTPPSGDVDVVWFGGMSSSQAQVDRTIEQQLFNLMPEFPWSVKNQGRMHLRNGDTPYASVADAMRHWPETATAVAVRLGASGTIEVNAPFGLDDLFALRLRPTPAFLGHKLPTFVNRFSDKRWFKRYPLLALETTEDDETGAAI